jgi:hypothetical protein
MSPRRDIPEAHRALKTLFHALIDACGGLHAAAACTRVGPSQLANYYDMKTDQFAPIDVVADLERVVGQPLVTAELARRAGWHLVPDKDDAAGHLAQSIARLTRDASEACGAYVEAASDGNIDAGEAEGLERRLADVARVVGTARATLRKNRK